MSDQDDNYLLKQLKRLYASLMSLHLGRLPNAYRRNSVIGSPSISSQLSSYIEKIAGNPANVTNAHGTANSQSVAESNINIDQSTLFPAPKPGLKTGTLSFYLNNIHKHSNVSLDTGDKLIDSTWDHIHTSIRYAHQGELEKARLHVQLASNAVKEASHYLTKEAYTSFTKEVMGVLKELIDQAEKS